MGNRNIESERLHLAHKQLRNETVAKVVIHALNWAGASILAACAYMSISALSGKTTSTDIGMNVVSDIKISDVFMALLTGSASVVAYRERKLRKSTTERLSGRIAKSETAIDPHRESSGLASTGDTHPRDK